MKTNRLTRAILPVVGFLFLAGMSNVHAATIQIGAGLGQITGNIEGFLTPVSNVQLLSSSNADAFNLGNANPTTETDFLNNTLLANPTAVFLSKQEPPQANPDGSYSITGLYFSLKLGNNTAYFKNMAGGPISFTLTTGQGAGLSHITQYNAVPLPAAVWLFGSALLGMVGIGYRRKTQNA